MLEGQQKLGVHSYHACVQPGENKGWEGANPERLLTSFRQYIEEALAQSGYKEGGMVHLLYKHSIDGGSSFSTGKKTNNKNKFEAEIRDLFRSLLGRYCWMPFINYMYKCQVGTAMQNRCVLRQALGVCCSVQRAWY